MYNIVERAKRMPVGVIATAVGAATLGNVYNTIGFTYVRTLVMAMGLVVFILSLIKLTIHREIFKGEYDNTILASLYGTFSMLSMILGAYIYPKAPLVGKELWLFGVIFHTCLIGIFTYKNVVKGFNIEKFAPSWFVTYNGIMVSIVVGGSMGMLTMKKIILYYGIMVFFLIIPFMIRRLIVKPLPDPIYHTLAVLLAPSSLCVVSYIEVARSINYTFITTLYGIVLITLLLIVSRIPKFFSFDFHPGFAGTTFPMAIGTVASLKMSGYLGSIGMLEYSNIVKNIAGLQIFMTTGIIIFVYYNFLKKAVRN